MKEIYSEKLKKNLNRNNRWLLLGIVFIIITIGCFAVSYKIDKQTNPVPVYLNQVIVNDNNKVDTYSYVEVSAIPYVFAEKSPDKFEDKFYFVRDENYFYITYLDYDTYNLLNRDDIANNPIPIFGKTQKTPDDIKKIAIEVYNDVIEENIINDSNFEDYFGSIYLDVVEPINDNSIPLSLAIIFGVFGLLFTIIYIVFRINISKSIKKLTTEEWHQVNNEIEDCNTVYYSRAKLYLTNNYLIDFSRGMVIIKYSDILWMYPLELKQYGVTTTKSIIIIDQNNKKHTIAGMNVFSKRAKNDFEETLNIIMDKNKDILLGFTNDNKQKVKEIMQTKKGL